MSLAQRLFLKDGRLRPILRSLVYVVASFVVAGTLGGIVAYLSGTTTPGSPRFFFAFECCLAVGAIGAGLVLRRYLDRRSIASLGFGLRGPWMRMLSIGLAIGVAMQLFVFFIDEAFGFTHVTGVATGSTDLWILAQYAPLFAVVALTEEFGFRGYLLQNVWEEWGPIAAIVVTTALFAVSHLGNPNSHASLVLTLAGLVAYGLWACASVLWTRSLWLAIGTHFSWNLFEGPVLGFPVSGLTFSATAVRQTVAGPQWFTGGPFGPEAGTSAFLALVLGFIVLWTLRRSGAFAGAPDVRETYAID